MTNDLAARLHPRGLSGNGRGALWMLGSAITFTVMTMLITTLHCVKRDSANGRRRHERRKLGVEGPFLSGTAGAGSILEVMVASASERRAIRAVVYQGLRAKIALATGRSRVVLG